MKSQLRRKLRCLSQQYQDLEENLLFSPSPPSPMLYPMTPMTSISCNPNTINPQLSYTDSHSSPTCSLAPYNSVSCCPGSTRPEPEMAMSQSRLLYYEISTSSPLPACPSPKYSMPASSIPHSLIPGKLEQIEGDIKPETQVINCLIPPPSLCPMPPSPLPPYPMPPSPLPSNPVSPTPFPPYPVSVSPMPMYPMPSNPLPPYPTPPSPVPPFPIPSTLMSPNTVPPRPMPLLPTPPSPGSPFPYTVSPKSPFRILSSPTPPYLVPLSPTPPYSIPPSPILPRPTPTSRTFPHPEPASPELPFLKPVSPVQDGLISADEITALPPLLSPTAALPLPPSPALTRHGQKIPAPAWKTTASRMPAITTPPSPPPTRPTQERIQENLIPFSLIPVSPIPSRPFSSRRRKEASKKRGLAPTVPVPVNSFPSGPVPSSPIPTWPSSDRRTKEDTTRRELIPTSPVPTSPVPLTPYTDRRRNKYFTEERLMPTSPVSNSPPFSDRRRKQGITWRGQRPNIQNGSNLIPASSVPPCSTPTKLCSRKSNKERQSSRRLISECFLPTNRVSVSPPPTSPIATRLFSSRRKGSPNFKETPSTSTKHSPLSSSPVLNRCKKQDLTGEKHIPRSQIPTRHARSSALGRSVLCSQIPKRSTSNSPITRVRTPGSPASEVIPTRRVPASLVPRHSTFASPIQTSKKSPVRDIPTNITSRRTTPVRPTSLTLISITRPASNPTVPLGTRPRNPVPTSLSPDGLRATNAGLTSRDPIPAIPVKSPPRSGQPSLPWPSPKLPPAGTLHRAPASPVTEQEADSQLSLKEVPAEGSLRAEPIVAVSQDPENQSAGESDSSSHAETSPDTGGGGSVSVATCEHRFSSSGGVPPPYSRLPPDGHEFPSNYAEGLPDKMSRYARYSRLAMELDSPGSPPPSTTNTPRTRSAPGTPLGPPPPIPRSSPTTTKTYNSERTSDTGNSRWAGNEERRSREPTPTRNRWRRQDERSERSVRDKIAMFSTDGPDQPHPKTRKLDKQEGEEGTMKRAFTEDDVRLDNSANSSTKSGRDAHSSPRSLSKTSVFSSMINVSTSEPKDNTKHIPAASSEVDIRQETPPTLRSHGTREEKRTDDDPSTSGLHSRSQSLIDIGRSSLTKRHSVGAYDRPSVYQYGIEKPEERERRTSLTNLIEQRRKSFGSKLLGLVIPESRGNEGGEKASIDLPRISSVPPTTAAKTMSLPREGQRSPRLYKADSISSIDSCESNTSRHSSLNAPPWKSHGTSTLPKYSPAFKRKNMTVFSKSDNLPPPSGRSHSACSTSPTSDLSQASPTPLSHSPPKSLETISLPGSEHTYDMNDGRYNSDRHSYNKLSLSQKNSLESRLNRGEDSDNDSAVSSTQSSYSQGMSPPSSPMPEQDELEDRRGRGYRSRLSQQNSLDEQDAARRVLKRGSIEAENRRNVINSARCSSGRNSDEHQTPEIIRKYSGASDKGEDSDRFPQRLDSELREGPKVTGLRRHPSTSSTSSTASSRRSSHDSSRRNSKDSVIYVTKYDEAKVSAEPVYFDQEGEMYKESQLKVAYVNEITDDYEQLNESSSKEVIAEVPLSSPPSRRIVQATDPSETSQTVSSPPRRGANRWAELEMKYGTTSSSSDIESKIQRMRRASDSSSPDRTKKNSGGFRALAEKWQQRAEEDTAAPPQPNPARRESNSRLEASARSTRQCEERSAATSTLERPARPSRLYDDQAEVDGNNEPAQPDLYSESTQSSSNSLSSSGDNRSDNLDIPRAEVPDRKLSMPEYGNGGIKMRDRREGGTGGAPSRPTSLIEGGDGGVMDSHYLTACAQLSPAASTDSRDDLFTPESSLSRTASKEVLDAFSRPRASVGLSFTRVGASTTPKMADIMRAFERSSHPRMSSLDSTNSDEGLTGAHYGSVTSLASGQRDQYGSITSLASSTSLISPQELAQLIEEANQSLEESGTPSHEILVVVLHREIVGHGSIGITLAGGADYEAKEITVHKVIPGSLADRDGRIQRGDRVLSINGKNLRGVTHKEALSILKSPRPEVVLVLSRSRSVTPQESNMTETDGNFIHRPSLINHVTSPRPPKILESPMDSKSLISDVAAMSVPRGPPFTITLVKDGAGLGFSLEGGKDSPLGDRPLTVKKIFSGGAADKGGVLKVGDELVSVNTVDVTGMARIEAWNFLKKLPDGTVSLVLRQKLEYSSAKNEE